METIKKRHNPEITAEDKKSWGLPAENNAVKAFDKNNDAKPTNSLEQKVLSEKGDNALKQEVCHLIEKVFGENLYLNFQPLQNQSANAFSMWMIQKLKRKESFFRNAEFEKYFTINLYEIPDKMEDGVVITKKSQPMYENGKFNPIKIIVYSPEALKQAREFVKSYKSLTGQEATLIQECVDEEEMKTHIPQKQNLEQKAEIENTKFELPALKELSNKLALSSMKFDLSLLSIYSLLTAANLGIAAENFSKGKYGIGCFNLFTGVLCGTVVYLRGKSALSKYEKSLEREEKK